MISIRLPEFLEKDLEEFARLQRKTKTDIVIDSLIFYLYYFLGFKKPKIKILKPEIEEKKRFITLYYDLPQGITNDAINIFHVGGYIFLMIIKSDRTIYYSKTPLPVVKKEKIVKRIKNKLVITLKKDFPRSIGIA